MTPHTPPYPNIGALLRDAARRWPERVAIDCFEDGERITYAQLNELSDRFANALLACGAQKGSHIATMLPNRLAYPISWLAIAKIGALMVPVTVSFTSRELGYVLNDSQSQFLLIGEEYLAILGDLTDRPTQLQDDHVIVLGQAVPGSMRNWDGLCSKGASTPPQALPVVADDLCGLQYTSGTTGNPKGCLVSHDYWMLLGRAMQAIMPPSTRRILSPNPFSYMNGRNLLLTAMGQGGTLFLARKPSTSRFMDWVHGYAIDWCWFPKLVLKQPIRADDARSPLKEVGTAAFTAEANRELSTRFSVTPREVFGMTEVGAAAAIPLGSPEMIGSGSIGMPMLGRQLSIRDEHGLPVSRGTTGELWIAGQSMMQGYYNKPEATAEAFSGLWFRSGDLAVEDERGFYFIKGRVKDTVRRSSENISAREVEDIAVLLDEIKDAAVIPVPDEERGEEVKIYVELQPGHAPTEHLVHRLAQHFGRNLAAFKVPRYYAFVQEFSRTPSNRVEKGVLRRSSPDLRLGAFDMKDQVWR